MTSQFLGPFEGSGLNFMNFSGKNLTERYAAFNHWGTLREEQNLWPFGLENDNRRPLNFGTQDYLGFSTNQKVIDSLKKFIQENGIIHSAGSPTLTGRTVWTAELEDRISSLLHQNTTLIFSSGWMACFGAISGLTNGKDTIVIDALAHNCMQIAAKFSTASLFKFNHNDMAHLDAVLERCRQIDDNNGLFIVSESLYSMNSDSPDLRRIMELAHKYEAIVIVDTAHDLGVMGKTGLGLLETIDLQYSKNLIICGAFSKAFGTNGGFVSGPADIRRQMIAMSPTYMFSTGASPLQCHIANKSLELIFSEEGEKLRNRLKELVHFTVDKFKSNGFIINGIPSQIVPVQIGHERLARMIFKKIFERGLLLNLIEFPAVPKGKAIFRFQLMASHKEKDIDLAIEMLKTARQEVQQEMIDLID
jgi:7-keto-8-aminopelargonate synthetase-like enzyme